MKVGEEGEPQHLQEVLVTWLDLLVEEAAGEGRLALVHLHLELLHSS